MALAIGITLTLVRLLLWLILLSEFISVIEILWDLTISV